MNIINAQTVGTVHTHTHTLCLQDKNLKSLGFINVTKKLYIKYENIKEDMQLLHRKTVF